MAKTPKGSWVEVEGWTGKYGRVWQDSKGKRRFGPGCIEAWARDAEGLNARASALLEPLARKVASWPFLLGSSPSVADAAVFGQLAFLELASPGWVAARAPGLTAWYGRVAAA